MCISSVAKSTRYSKVSVLAPVYWKDPPVRLPSAPQLLPDQSEKSLIIVLGGGVMLQGPEGSPVVEVLLEPPPEVPVTVLPTPGFVVLLVPVVVGSLSSPPQPTR